MKRTVIILLLGFVRVSPFHKKYLWIDDIFCDGSSQVLHNKIVLYPPPQTKSGYWDKWELPCLPVRLFTCCPGHYFLALVGSWQYCTQSLMCCALDPRSYSRKTTAYLAKSFSDFSLLLCWIWPRVISPSSMSQCSWSHNSCPGHNFSLVRLAYFLQLLSPPKGVHVFWPCPKVISKVTVHMYPKMISCYIFLVASWIGVVILTIIFNSRGACRLVNLTQGHICKVRVMSVNVCKVPCPSSEAIHFAFTVLEVCILSKCFFCPTKQQCLNEDGDNGSDKEEQILSCV